MTTDPVPAALPPLEAFEAAIREALGRILALSDRELPPGLATRPRDDASDLIDVLSEGRVIGAMSSSVLLQRAWEIAAQRD